MTHRRAGIATLVMFRSNGPNFLCTKANRALGAHLAVEALSGHALQPDAVQTETIRSLRRVHARYSIPPSSI